MTEASLALPRLRTRVRKRIKRPRRPSGFAALCLFVACVEAAVAVRAGARGDAPTALFAGLLAGIYWKAYQLLRAERDLAAAVVLIVFAWPCLVVWVGYELLVR